jgi:hypothetical protein
MTDKEMLDNQAKILLSCQAELIRQKERLIYWINVLGIQSDVIKDQLARPLIPKVVADTQLKEQKLNLLLEELFKTLKSK